MAVMLIAACGRVVEGGSQPDLSGRKIRVVATTGMISDVAKNIGGERTEVVALMGPGVDPHLYKASEGDVQRLVDADIVFYNGLHLEARMAEVIERMDERPQTTTVAVTDLIDHSLLLTPPQFEGAYDPHVWFDVSFWMKAAEEIRDTYINVDPANAGIYQRNADAYLQQLGELDAYVKAQAERVPAENRVLVTAHDAFNYFGRAYGFEVMGLQGISTATEAGTGDVQSLADTIAERQIPAIFVESSVPVRTIEALQAAVQSRGWDVQIGGQLYSDAMGQPGTEDGTYIGMVRHNIDTIVSALLGESSEAAK